jgi:hypothetical protein
MSTAKKTKPELWSRKVAAAKAKFGKALQQSGCSQS